MKKLSVLLIAILFCVLSAGSSLADEPSTLDRHAVWNKWGDDDNRTPEATGVMRPAMVLPGVYRPKPWKMK